MSQHMTEEKKVDNAAEAHKKASFSQRWVTDPAKKLWTEVLSGVLKFLWILFCIVVFPVGLFIAVRWVITGGAKYFAETFGRFLFGTWKTDPKTGEVLYMSFVCMPDIFHFHILCWPLTLMAVIQWGVGKPLHWVGITFIVLHGLAIRTFFKDIALQKFLFRVFTIIPLLVLADVGVRLGFQNLWGNIEGRELMVFHYTFPENIDFGKHGVIVPLWNWFNSHDLTVSSWFLFIYSLLWWWFITKIVIDAALNRRNELDSRDLQRYRYGETEDTEPVYMRSSTLRFMDVFEVLFSFSGDLVLDTRRGKIRFKNVFGLLWLRYAYEQLRNSKTIRERKLEARSAQTEDAAELAKLPHEDHHHQESDAHGLQEDDDHEAAVDAYEQDTDNPEHEIEAGDAEDLLDEKD